MEDSRTKATLDALADLVLTGTTPRSRAASSPGNTAPIQTQSPQPDPLTGPRPIRMSPKLRAAALVEMSSPAPAIVMPPKPAVPPSLRLHRSEHAIAANQAALPSRSEATPKGVDEAASLDAGSESSDSHPVELHVEAVFLGNL